jgi:hypothetical protein
MIENRQPTVSVVIPTFNRATLISNAIESVLNQTYKPHEIIVVDDGSTDNTTEKLMPYEGNIRYFRQANGGASAAQNKGVDLATGEWVSILASDDLWLPTKLERQIKALYILGPEFGACFTDCSFFGSPNSPRWSRTAFEQADLIELPEIGPMLDPFKYFLAKYALIYVQSLMVRRCLVEEIGGFDERLVVAEDQGLLFRLACRTKLCYVNMPLVRIDRTESHEGRLTELFAERDDRMFCSMECIYLKWLSLPELLDSVIREQIQMGLRDLYEDWIIAKLYRHKYDEAFVKVKQQRRNGVSYARTLGALAFRATRKLSSRFHG